MKVRGSLSHSVLIKVLLIHLQDFFFFLNEDATSAEVVLLSVKI